MNEKKYVLEQLDEIQSSLMDNEKFCPYNYNVLILWGIVSAILFLSLEYIAQFGKLYSVSYIGIIIFITLLIESYYIKKENLKYDLTKFTKTQKFIDSIYIFSTIFSLFLTYIFMSNNLGLFIYIIWIFMIGFSNYIVGFIINNKYFTLVGMINIVLVFVILSIGIMFGMEVFKTYIPYIAVLFSSFGCIFIGIKTKKEI